jgi:AcrR family transcriptional regulator
MAYRETPRIAARKQETRQVILRASAKLVSAGNSLSMEAVAQGAGMAVGSLYTYFANRRDLVLGLFEERAELEIAAITAALQEAELSPAARLAAAVERIVDRAFKNPGMTLFLLLERMDRDERLEAAKLAYHRRHGALIAAVIEEGVARGDFPPQAAQVTGAAVLGLVIEVIVRALSGARADALAQMERSLLQQQLSRSVLAICGADAATLSQIVHGDYQ